MGKTFSINETVVYSGHGVGVIKEIVQKTVANEVIDYYVIYLPDSDMTMWVPQSQTEALGVRAMISPEMAREALKFLSEVNEPVIMDWKARYQKNMQLFKSGDIKNTAVVLKSLYRRSKVKELPIQERKLYEASYHIFQDEIVAVLGLPEREVEEMIHIAIEPVGEEEVVKISKKSLTMESDEDEIDVDDEIDEDM